MASLPLTIVYQISRGLQENSRKNVRIKDISVIGSCPYDSPNSRITGCIVVASLIPTMSIVWVITSIPFAQAVPHVSCIGSMPCVPIITHVTVVTISGGAWG